MFSGEFALWNGRNMVVVLSDETTNSCPCHGGSLEARHRKRGADLFLVIYIMPIRYLSTDGKLSQWRKVPLYTRRERRGESI